jgi:AdoMet-dependent rRNA methyltransferase SPB1
MWFGDEEKVHNIPTLPVTKDMVMEAKAKFKELNARPIKKVAEAKARKKLKLMKKAEKTKARAQVIADSNDMRPAEKSRAIERLYKKSMAKAKSEKKYVVSRKAGGTSKAAKGASGQTKVVDPRMKKDKRANAGKQQSKRRKK